MAKPNYQYEKRQRELAKKAKKAEKAARKGTGGDAEGEGEPDPSQATAVPADTQAPTDGTPAGGTAT